MSNKFLGFLGKVGLGAAKAIPEIVSIAYPPLSGLMGVVSSLTLKAQADHGPGNNEVKKAQVLQDLGLFQPFIIPLIEQIAGKDLDDEAFTKLISDIIDINVQWHKLVGSIPPNVILPGSLGTLLSPVPVPAAPAVKEVGFQGIPGVVVSGPGILPVAGQ
jgi:hypothetical protein